MNCKECNGVLIKTRGYVCNKCRYKKYPKLPREYYNKKSADRKLIQSNFLPKDECIQWIEKRYNDKLLVNLKDLLVDLITVYESMGGSLKKLDGDELKPNPCHVQLKSMWEYVDRKYKSDWYYK
jgi:hypothetical protein